MTSTFLLNFMPIRKQEANHPGVTDELWDWIPINLGPGTDKKRTRFIQPPRAHKLTSEKSELVSFPTPSSRTCSHWNSYKDSSSWKIATEEHTLGWWLRGKGFDLTVHGPTFDLWPERDSLCIVSWEKSSEQLGRFGQNKDFSLVRLWSHEGFKLLSWRV